MPLHVLTTALLLASTTLLYAQVDPEWQGRTTYTVEFAVPEIRNEAVKGYLNHFSNSEVQHSEASTNALLDHLYQVLQEAEHPMFSQSPLGEIDYSQLVDKEALRATLGGNTVYSVDVPAKEEIRRPLKVQPVERKNCVGIFTQVDVYYNAATNAFECTPWILAPFFQVMDLKTGALKGWRTYAYPSTQQGKTPVNDIAKAPKSDPLHNPNLVWGERITIGIHPDETGKLIVSRMGESLPLKRLLNTKLHEHLYAQALAGNLTAYADENCTQAMPLEQLHTLCSDTIVVWKEDANEQMQRTPTVVQTPASAIQTVRFSQQWSFEREGFNFNTNIASIGIVAYNYDSDTGNHLGTQTIFWVKTE